MKTTEIYYIILILIIFSGCKKDFLDKKPSTSIVVPKTLPELQSLLENSTVMNLNGALGQISSDDIIIPSYNDYQALIDLSARNAYIWNKDIYEGQTGILDWNALYKTIFYANNVLSELSNNQYKDITARDNLRGSALFFRAYAFYDLATTFSKAYSPLTAENDLGIPLRLEPGIDYVLQRSTLKETYHKIIDDLQQALPLLTNDVKITNPNMPTRTAVFGTLARIYLSMGDYENAEANADNCLKIYDKLIDFNSLNRTALSPFGYVTTESIFFASQVAFYNDLTSSSSSIKPYSINPELINLYDKNDLRSEVFFIKHPNGIINGKRRYTLNPFPYTGVATDEIYLIKAECLARRDEINQAMIMLNKLLLTRFVTGTYVNIQFNSKEEAIDKILVERRKELVQRGLRWSDLKRLNRENKNIVLTRVLNGSTYTLTPNDPRYIFPIPPDEISVSGIQQNIR